MLDINHDEQLIDELWESAATKVSLSDSFRKLFFASHGAMPMFHDNRRAYHRYFMRGKAVVLRGDASLAAYTKDVSRQGVGFLSPVQLLPKERVKLRLPKTQLSLEIARCRRVEPGCFECGARFALEPGLIRSTN
jgi:PilZ domain